MKITHFLFTLLLPKKRRNNKKAHEHRLLHLNVLLIKKYRLSLETTATFIS